ncbi:MAG: hypothetical protein ACSLE5_12165 [Porticoccaceae bacterium]
MSMIVMVDGEHVLPMATSQDHQRVGDAIAYAIRDNEAAQHLNQARALLRSINKTTGRLNPLIHPPHSGHFWIGQDDHSYSVGRRELPDRFLTGMTAQ